MISLLDKRIDLNTCTHACIHIWGCFALALYFSSHRVQLSLVFWCYEHKFFQKTNTLFSCVFIGAKMSS